MKLGLILTDLTQEQAAQLIAQFGPNIAAAGPTAPAPVGNGVPAGAPGSAPAGAPAMPGAPAAVPPPSQPAPAPAPVTPPAAQGKAAQVLNAMNTYAQTHGLEGCKTVLGRLGLTRVQDAQDGHLDWLLAVFSNPAITPAQAAAS
jgi:hypothetical protein